LVLPDVQIDKDAISTPEGMQREKKYYEKWLRNLLGDNSLCVIMLEQGSVKLRLLSANQLQCLRKLISFDLMLPSPEGKVEKVEVIIPLGNEPCRFTNALELKCLLDSQQHIMCLQQRNNMAPQISNNNRQALQNDVSNKIPAFESLQWMTQQTLETMQYWADHLQQTGEDKLTVQDKASLRIYKVIRHRMAADLKMLEERRNQITDKMQRKMLEGYIYKLNIFLKLKL